MSGSIKPNMGGSIGAVGDTVSSISRTYVASTSAGRQLSSSPLHEPRANPLSEITRAIAAPTLFAAASISLSAK